jgi:hypothetical protein
MSVKRLIKLEDSMFKNRVFLNVLIYSLFFLQKNVFFEKTVLFEIFNKFTNDLVSVETTKVLQYLGQILRFFLVCNLGDLICAKVFLPL